MRAKLELEKAFIRKKFACLFLGIIFSLNTIILVWFFFFSNLKKIMTVNKNSIDFKFLI